MFKVTFREERCKGCGLCIDTCPKKIIFESNKLNEKGYYCVEIIEEGIVKCIGCASCAKMCPDSVISIYKYEEDNNEQ